MTGSQSGVAGDYCLLGCYAISPSEEPPFWLLTSWHSITSKQT